MGHVLHLEPGIHQGAAIHLEPVQAAPAAPDVDTADHILDGDGDGDTPHENGQMNQETPA